MIQILPAILATTEEEYKEAVSKINSSDELSGGMVHVDVADGIYVNSKTFWGDFSKYPLQLEKEAHLMVSEPTSFVTRLSLYKFKRVLFHLGVGKEDHIIEIIKQRHLGVGLVLNPEMWLDQLKPYLEKIDVVLLMGVHPGKQGQDFIPETLDKIKDCARLRKDNALSFKIGVDGGVSPDNIKSIMETGADYAVVGSRLLNGDINENLESFWEAIL